VIQAVQPPDARRADSRGARGTARAGGNADRYSFGNPRAGTAGVVGGTWPPRPDPAALFPLAAGYVVDDAVTGSARQLNPGPTIHLATQISFKAPGPPHCAPPPDVRPRACATLAANDNAPLPPLAGEPPPDAAQAQRGIPKRSLPRLQLRRQLLSAPKLTPDRCSAISAARAPRHPPYGADRQHLQMDLFLRFARNAAPRRRASCGASTV
jgi:hypothetical protein